VLSDITPFRSTSSIRISRLVAATGSSSSRSSSNSSSTIVVVETVDRCDKHKKYDNRSDTSLITCH